MGVNIDLPSGTVGALHELLVCADLMMKGYNVFRAMSPSCSCDIMATKADVIYRIEVTTGIKYPSTGRISYPAHKNGRYLFDILAVVFHNGEIIYHKDGGVYEP